MDKENKEDEGSKNETSDKLITKEKSFASGLNFYKLFWVFFIGCFAGVVVETFWCFITKFKFESRQGLIYGPFNLVYGVGALLITVCLYKIYKKNDRWLFLGGFVIGNIFEYICSLLQEKLFGTISWDYSSTPLAINGRINLVFSGMWGLLSVIWFRWIYPKLEYIIEKIPNKIGKTLTWILLVFMIFNTAISGLAVGRQKQRREGKEATNKIEVFLDEHYNDELLNKVYPNMKIVK